MPDCITRRSGRFFDDAGRRREQGMQHGGWWNLHLPPQRPLVWSRRGERSGRVCGGIETFPWRRRHQRWDWGLGWEGEGLEETCLSVGECCCKCKFEFNCNHLLIVHPLVQMNQKSKTKSTSKSNRRWGMEGGGRALSVCRLLLLQVQVRVQVNYLSIVHPLTIVQMCMTGAESKVKNKVNVEIKAP